MTEKKLSQPRLIPVPGEEDFADLRKDGVYYVDKTQYLKPLFRGTETMSTLRCFLEMNYQNPGDTSVQEELFRGLKVTEDREFCAEHMGRNPVVSLSQGSKRFRI